MLIYDYLRGVSVVSSLGVKKLLIFKFERQYVIYSIKGRKRVTKIYVFFGIGWKRGNKCRKYGMRIESMV